MESTPAGEARLGLAISLAARYRAALTLLQVIGHPVETAREVGAVQAAESANRALMDRIEREGVRAEWRSVEVAVDVGLIEAKQADLTGML